MKTRNILLLSTKRRTKKNRNANQKRKICYLLVFEIEKYSSRRIAGLCYDEATCCERRRERTPPPMPPPTHKHSKLVAQLAARSPAGDPLLHNPPPTVLPPHNRPIQCATAALLRRLQRQSKTTPPIPPDHVQEVIFLSLTTQLLWLQRFLSRGLIKAVPRHKSGDCV